MNWTPNPADPQIFHITHFANLPGIIAHGGLWSDAQRIQRALVSTNIGYSHIKGRRLRRPVPVAAGGMLGEYVPFNFCPRSVMLYVVGRGHADYSGGEQGIVHLVSRVSRATALGQPWCFTDRHADLGYAIYYAQHHELAQVDWAVMPVERWGGDEEMKQKRQAEFLVHQFFEWAAVDEIAVRDQATHAQVQAALQAAAHRPPVVVRRDWYY